MNILVIQNDPIVPVGQLSAFLGGHEVVRAWEDPQRLQDLGDRTIGRVDRSEAGDVADGGVGVELGHEVVVVGVEPLGHLQGGALALAAGCGEEARQGGARELAGLGVRTAGITGTAAQVAEALRQSPESGGDLKDLVVIGEIRGDGGGAGQPQPAQTSAGGGPQGGGALSQPGDVQGALPVGLDVAFELAVGTDAGVAEDRGGGQGRTGGRWGRGERHMRYFLSFLGVLVGGDRRRCRDALGDRGAARASAA